MNYSTPITIQSYTRTQDDLGEVQITPSTSLVIGADIRQGSGVIAVSAAKETESIVMFFTVLKTPFTESISNNDDIITEDGNKWEMYNIDMYTYDDKVRLTARLRR